MTINHSSRIAVAVLTAAGAALAVSQPAAMATAAQRAPSVSAQDRTYLHDSMQGDLFEVRGGHVAKHMSTRAAVDHFGARMVRDHSKAYAEAKKTAHEVGVAVPTKPSAGQRQVLALWRTLPRHALPCAYITYEWADHQLDIADAEDEITSGSNPSVIADARQDLPVLKAHLRMDTRILRHMRGC